MHILIVPSWYITPTKRNRGIFFRDQARALQKAGHQVGVLVPPSRLRTLHGLREVVAGWRRGPSDYDFTDDDGLPTYRMPWWGWRGSLQPAYRQQAATRLFEAYCERHGTPDILHAHSILYGGYVAVGLGQRYGIPSVITEHNERFLRHKLHRDQVGITRKTVAGADALVAVSQPLADALREYGASDVGVIGNVLDTDFFQPSTHMPPPSPFTFTIIGDVYANKGHGLLLRAFLRFRGQSDVRLWIIGGGPLRQRCEQQASDLGLAEQVVFHGKQPRAAVRDLIQRSHAVVSASYNETFGVSLIEAMACGKPVIATRSGGPQSFVTEQTGMLVPVGDAEALGQAMQEMRSDYSHFDADDIRAYCVQGFGEAAIATQLVSLYEKVLKRR